MQDSHTTVSEGDTAADASTLGLTSATALGLPERLAGRLDERLAAFVAHMTQGLLAASTAVGLEVMAELLDAEVTELAGPKGRHDPARVAKRHGSQPGTVTLGGRRVPVRRPRVRSVGDGEHELALASYQTFAATDLLAEGIVARMLAGGVHAPLPGWAGAGGRRGRPGRDRHVALGGVAPVRRRDRRAARGAAGAPAGRPPLADRVPGRLRDG
jgi:hypothetical protein